MTIEYLSSKRLQGVTADTKPTNVPTGTEFMNTQTRVLSIFNGTTWDDVAGSITTTSTDTLINKTINTTDNTVTATSQATGDILSNNGTKFVRKARGTSLQVLRTNSGGTDIEWASLDNMRVGKSQANGNTTSYTIAHGLGSTPTYFYCDLYSHAIDISYTVDGTNINVTTASTTPAGTNNILFTWWVIA